VVHFQVQVIEIIAAVQANVVIPGCAIFIAQARNPCVRQRLWISGFAREGPRAPK
jgi:hypothetical protein